MKKRYLRNTEVSTSLLCHSVQPYHVCVISMFHFGFVIFNRSIKTLFLNTVCPQLKHSSRILIKLPHSAMIFISKNFPDLLRKEINSLFS